MDPELVKFINSDLTWNAVKKGHRSMIRRPRRPGASSSELVCCPGNKMQDSIFLDYEKSGVAILGQHFGEEMLDVPIKKRILRLQSPSLSSEGARSPQPQTHSLHREEPELLVASKHASVELCHSSKSGLNNSKHIKLIEKEISALSDFSGIELLAAAACHSSVYDSSGHLEASALAEHTHKRVDSYADCIKEDITPMESDDSLVQDDTFPATQNLCDDGNGGGDESPGPSKEVRLHWDLNTLMDEWEEPSCDIHVDPHSERSYSRDVYGDGLQSGKANMEDYETKIAPATGGEQENILHSVCVDQSGKHEGTISVVPLSKPEIFGIQENNDTDSFDRAYVADDIVSSKEVVGAITGKTSDAESCLSKSDVVDSFVHPTKCEIVSTSTTSVSLGQTTVKVESDIYFESSNKFDNKQAVSEVLQGECLPLKGDGDDKVTSEDHLSDCCGSNVSQDERGHMAEGNTIDKVKAGYDSPVEDGELREPIRYPWQMNELEERECVDYESDNTYEDNFDTIESVKHGIAIDHHQDIGQLGAAVSKNDIEQDDKADASNNLLGSKASEYQLQEHSQCAILEEKNDHSGKFLPVRKVASDEFHGRNLSCNDRSVSFGVQRDGAFAHQSRFDEVGYSYSRGERNFGPEKFMRRDGPFYKGRARNDASGPWGDSSIEAWDSRYNHGHPRPKNVIGGSVRSGGSSYLDKNQAISYNPRGIYRTFNTRPSSSDRNESYGISRGTSPARGVSRDRGRIGSGFHLQGLRRAPQEEYKVPEPSYSQRKVPCFSSNFNRGGHLSRSRRRSRSRSRSRSGSPIAWHFLKKRNVDTKRQSPDYRPDTRFEGDRFPFRQPSSSGEIEAGLVSPTTGHVSPQCISRNFDDRDVVNAQHRDRRSSPVRALQRNQRFEADEFLGRLKSNDHFRPTPQPGRFPQATGPNREKFEGNSKGGTIHGDKYRTMNGGRPFRHPVDESYKTRNTRDKDNGYRHAYDENRCFKDHSGRDLREHTSGEKHH